MRPQLVGAEADAPVQALLALVYPVQHVRGGEPFEGAAHGEAFVEAVAFETAVRVQYGDTQAAAGGAFDRRPGVLGPRDQGQGSECCGDLEVAAFHGRNHSKCAKARLPPCSPRPSAAAASGRRSTTPPRGSWTCTGTT